MKKQVYQYTAPALTVVSFRAERGFAGTGAPLGSVMHIFDGNDGDNGKTESFGWQSSDQGYGSSGFWRN